jgi:hypothetical protein
MKDLKEKLRTVGTFRIDKDTNEIIGFKLNPRIAVCELDCGAVVRNQKFSYNLYLRCKYCNICHKGFKI